MLFKSNSIFFFVGFFILVLGIVLILQWWPEVVNLFKAVTGMILALAGLIVLWISKR